MLSGRVRCGVLAFLALSALANPSNAERQPKLLLGVTTTVENSGLLAHILPRFRRSTGITVRPIVRGTGEILRVARAGDVDVFIAHDRPAERAFVRAGHGIARRDIMHNHFLIVGPKDDPAGIGGVKTIALALAKIASKPAFFASRGDDSGTHRVERAQWRAAGIDPRRPRRRWYLETGAGMGATLNVAAGRGAYALTDFGTWLAYKNKNGLVALVDANRTQINRYGVTLVAPKKITVARAKGARRFFEWLTGPAGQGAIMSYRIGGSMPFTPALPTHR